MQVNSVDSWNRHRIEGYGFARFPDKPGYHQIEVQTWRPRASLDTEIHSFFLGGSVRIQKLEELVRTKYISTDGFDDIVNRFGLETEDAGKITVHLNICSQDLHTRRTKRSEVNMLREKEKLETRKLVMVYRRRIEKERNQAREKNLRMGYGEQNEDSYDEYNNDYARKGRDSSGDENDRRVPHFGYDQNRQAPFQN